MKPPARSVGAAMSTSHIIVCFTSEQLQREQFVKRLKLDPRTIHNEAGSNCYSFARESLAAFYGNAVPGWIFTAHVAGVNRTTYRDIVAEVCRIHRRPDPDFVGLTSDALTTPSPLTSPTNTPMEIGTLPVCVPSFTLTSVTVISWRFVTPVKLARDLRPTDAEAADSASARSQ